MELTLTPEQIKYLNENSPIKADTLKDIYKKSVQDQQETLKHAAAIRARNKRTK